MINSLWLAWKVLLSGMQRLVKYGCFQCRLDMSPMLLAANAAGCMPHAPNPFLWNRQISTGVLPIFYKQLYIQKFFVQVFCAYNLGLYFFGERILVQKLLIKCWWNWHLNALSIKLESLVFLRNDSVPNFITGAYSIRNEECHLAKGKQPAAIFSHTWKLHTFLYICKNWHSKWSFL